MSYPVETALAQNWIIPFALGGSEYYSGYAIANPNEVVTVQTDVTIDIVSGDGSVIEDARTQVLADIQSFRFGEVRIPKHDMGPVVLKRLVE